MRFMQVSLASMLLVALTGCAANWQSMGIGLSGSPNPPYVHADLPIAQALQVFSTPRLEVRDCNGGWPTVNQRWFLSGTQGAQTFRLVPGGRVISAEANYDGRKIRLGNGHWEFSVRNFRDGGNRLLIVLLTIQEPGYAPRYYELDCLVFNGY